MKDLRQQSVNTFLGGMNKDAADSYLKENQYRHAENFRIISDQDGQFGCLNNIQGTLELISSNQLQTSNVYSIVKSNLIGGTFGIEINGVPVVITMLFIQSYQDFYKELSDAIKTQFPFIKTAYNRQHLVIYTEDPLYYSFITIGLSLNVDLVISTLNDLTIVGSHYVRNDVILFTTSRSNNTYGQIWKMNYSFNNSPPTATIELLYNNILNFSLNSPIRDVVGNYENEECKKVYFTDHNNYIRSFNYADPNAFALDPTTLDIIGDVALSKPKLDNITAGSLKCGVIQYAYKLYNKYYGETSLSPLSNLIHLAVGSDFAANDVAYKGEDGTTNSGKALRILIPNIDKRYDYITVYSVFYPDGSSTPEINKIVDSYVDADDFYFTDNGTTILGSLTIDEFNIYSTSIYKSKSLSTKNNLLLIANTSGEIFDVEYDARAYRFGLKGGILVSQVYEEPFSPANIYDINTSFQHNGADIPLNRDVIPYNQDYYRFQKNGLYLGGSGPNVEYKIEVLPLAIGFVAGPADNPTVIEGSANEPWSTWINSDFVDNKSSFTGYASPFNSGQFRGYMREETYRFGIIFYNKKGLRSSVKWIGDVKMPAITDTVPYALYQDRYGNDIFDFKTSYRINGGIYDGEQYAAVLHLNFSVNIPASIADEVAAFEIVRTDRDGKNRTVVTQGFAGPTLLHSGSPDIYRIHDVYNAIPPGDINNVATFSSPEGIFDKNIEFKNQDKFAKVAKLTGYNAATSPTNPLHIVTYHTVTPISTGISKRPIVDLKFVKADLEDQNLFSSESNTLQRYINSVLPLLGTYVALGGSTNLLSVKAVDAFDFSNFNLWGNLVNIYRDTISQYNGKTYDNRTTNTYITTGSYKRVLGPGIYSNIITFGGDIFIGFFDIQRLLWLLPNEDASLPTRSEAIIFPVETTINLALRTDKSYFKTKNYRLQEAATKFLGPTSAQEYDQSYDLYQYNPAYSRNPNVYLYFAENLNFVRQDVFDCRIRASQRKTNGHFIDSWTVFKTNNYIDIDTSLGSITKIINHNNIVYAFQSNGLGIASIDDRKIVQSTDSSNIVLGTGDVLPRYDYVSRQAGTSHQYSVIASDTALYFFDANDRQIKVYMGQEASISDNFGIKSYMYTNIDGNILYEDNPFVGLGIHGYYDDKYSEIVFTFLKARQRDPITIAFNESLKTFTGFYSFAPFHYIKHPSAIFSSLINTVESDTVFIHNFGEYNNFYNNTFESTIHLVLNKEYQNIKVFDSLLCPAEITEENINVYNDFFHYIRCWNEYQNTDWHELIYDDLVPIGKQINFGRRERIFSLQLPRNIVDQTVISNPDIFDPAFLNNVNRPFRERLKSKSLNIELRFVNPNNRKISIPLITSLYRMSAR